MADNKLILTSTEYSHIPLWSDEPMLYKDELHLTHNGTEYSYSVAEGESEDMIFGRNLEDCGSIIDMIKLAYECGKQGIELKINLNNNGHE